MDTAALRHEATARWCFATAPGRFCIRMQAAQGDLAAVTLHALDKYRPAWTPPALRAVPMRRVAADGCRDTFEAEFTMDVVCLRYWFELTDRAGRTAYFAMDTVSDTAPADTDRMFDCPQTLREEERFLTPAWAAGKVVYQVFPARFAPGREVPDALWYKAPVTNTDALGGDLRGLAGRLGYIRDLGADVLYLTPVFKANTQHKYDTVDYYAIDPDFGTEADLCALVRKAHALGLRVVLDGVFNHTAPNFFAFADVLKNGAASPYRAWYYTDGAPRLPKSWHEKPNYKCFGYFGGMPKLNQQNEETAQYFVNVALYWLRTAGIDGWRLDVGDEISHRFWRRLRAAVKAEFPDALIVGEVWHTAPDFLQGDEWDTVMNYPFYQAVLDLVVHGRLTAGRFLERMGFLRASLHPAVVPLLWNLIGSHDTPRILNECGGDTARLKLAAALQLLWPGMPMIYYGDEAGMAGARDPDCRRGMLWDPARRNAEVFDWYKALLAVRRAHPCLAVGDALAQAADDATGLITVVRGDARERLTLLFNTGAAALSLPQYAGREELLTARPFAGVLPARGTAVLRGELRAGI